eukprot:202723_1
MASKDQKPDLAKQNTVTLRRELLRMNKVEIVKKCKLTNVPANGSKADMVKRLVNHHRDNNVEIHILTDKNMKSSNKNSKVSSNQNTINKKKKKKKIKPYEPTTSDRVYSCLLCIYWSIHFMTDILSLTVGLMAFIIGNNYKNEQILDECQDIDNPDILGIFRSIGIAFFILSVLMVVASIPIVIASKNVKFFSKQYNRRKRRKKTNIKQKKEEKQESIDEIGCCYECILICMDDISLKKVTDDDNRSTGELLLITAIWSIPWIIIGIFWVWMCVIPLANAMSFGKKDENCVPINKLCEIMYFMLVPFVVARAIFITILVLICITILCGIAG